MSGTARLRRSILVASLAWTAAGSVARGEEAALLALSAGEFDANRRADTAVELGIQFRPRTRLGRFATMWGGMVTSDGSLQAFVGLSLDARLGRRVILRPSFAPGYFRRGGGKDLGSALEFRSALELSFRLEGGWRVGLEVYHLSNAALGDRNPGAETLAVTLSVPVGRRRDPADWRARSQRRVSSGAASPPEPGE